MTDSPRDMNLKETSIIRLWDDSSRRMVSYDLSTVFASLDVALAGAENCQCLYVELENTPASALLAFYLLHRKVNCHFSKKQEPGHMPPFCNSQVHPGGAFVDELRMARLLNNEDGHAVHNDLQNTRGLVLFQSSGTTGDVKFVCFRSEVLLENARNFAKFFGLHAGTTILVPVPIYHMFGLGVGLLPAMLSGAAIVLPAHTHIVTLYQHCFLSVPDVVLLTPSICKMMLAYKKQLTCRPRFISAGESISEKLYSEFEMQYGTLVNLYGSTEMGAMATTPLTASGAERWQGTVQSLPGVEITLCEENGEVLCRHHAGFWGYLMKGTDLVKYDPHTWFQTRDWGTWLSTDRFVVKGRIDNCINRLGFLVSLEQVEMLLERLLTGVAKVAVCDIDKPTMKGGTLVAFLCNEKDSTYTTQQVKDLCRKHLARQLIPDEFVFTRSLPKLGTGKLDRHSLNQFYHHLTSIKL